MRLVALIAARTHVVTALVHADYRTGEATLWKDLWHQLPDASVTLVDRAFLSANDLHHLAASGQKRHWVTRAKTTTRLRVVELTSLVDAHAYPASEVVALYHERWELELG